MKDTGQRKHGNFKGATRARSCESKLTFRTAGLARKNRNKMLNSGRVTGSTRVYPCRFCGLWHWGHNGGPTDRYARVVNAIDRALARDEQIRRSTQGEGDDG